jgi:hypothetical protein
MSTQQLLDVADELPKAPSRFDGETYEPKRDAARLSGQLERVRDLMLDGKWRTLREIANHVQGSEAGVSARLRDLRKERFGSHTVNHQRKTDGVWIYQVVR